MIVRSNVLGLRDGPADPIMKDRGAILEIAQALTGTQFRAGLGLYILDDAFNDATKGNLDGVMRLFGNGVGNIANTFTIPFTFPQDVYNSFIADDEYRQVRQTKSSDLNWSTCSKDNFIKQNPCIELQRTLQIGLAIACSRNILLSLIHI